MRDVEGALVAGRYELREQIGTGGSGTVFRAHDRVLDRDVARTHLQVFEDDLRHSRPLSLEEFRDRSIFIKLADHFFGLFRSQF